MRLLCVDANRKMAVVLTNFSAVFPFVTCVKESENQPNGFGESRRNSQPSPFRRSSLNKRSRLDNLFLSTELIIIDHFTVVSLATWPLNGSEAGGDLVLIQTSLLLLCKSTCSYAN